MQAFLAAFSAEIKQCDPVWFWLGFAIVTMMAGLAFWRMICRYQHGKLIENTPTAKVRSAAQGYIELIGTAEMMDGPVIVSPVSGRACVWYHYIIEERMTEYDSHGRSRKRWRVIKNETSEELFLLHDGTGQCVIDPDDADVFTHQNRRWNSIDLPQQRRYQERLILAGEPLYAIGWFKTETEIVDQSIRQQASYLLREWKQHPEWLLQQYDADNNGQISTQEWEKARLDATTQVKRRIGQQSQLTPLSIMRASPNKGQHYILSVEPEKKLIWHYQRRALSAMLIFLVLGIGLVWTLNQRIGL